MALQEFDDDDVLASGSEEDEFDDSDDLMAAANSELHFVLKFQLFSYMRRHVRRSVVACCQRHPSCSCHSRMLRTRHGLLE